MEVRRTRQRLVGVLLLVGVVALGSPALAVSSATLLVNGSFDSGLGGWTTNPFPGMTVSWQADVRGIPCS
jgi:hypothetical protein